MKKIFFSLFAVLLFGSFLLAEDNMDKAKSAINDKRVQLTSSGVVELWDEDRGISLGAAHYPNVQKGDYLLVSGKGLYEVSKILVELKHFEDTGERIFFSTSKTVVVRLIKEDK